MKRFLTQGLFGLLASLPAGFAHSADAAHPTVIELYESQGCSSCPPANANLNAIADRPDVLALNFAVTYWDRLGWKDTFAQQSFTDRQYAYAGAQSQSSVFTPQMIVNGTGGLVGIHPHEVADAIQRYDRGNGGPQIDWGKGTVVISQAGGADAVVWLVRYDPRDLEVAIGRGENAGRKLPHRNIVKELVQLGAVNGGSASFDLPSASDPALRTAVMVQQGTGGPILSAAKMP